MRIRDLSWILALGDQQHMTAAADVLGVPQSTLSRALSRVEDELGVQIFERRQSGLTTTPLGALVLDAASDIEVRYRRLESDIANAVDPDTGIVRLAFLDSMGASVVPRLLRRFREVAPGVRVLLTQERSNQITADLLAQRVDLALTSSRPNPGAGWLPLRTDRLVLLVPRGHRLADRTRVRLAEIAHEPFITTPSQLHFRSQVDALFDAAGVSPTLAFESQDPATIEGLVSVGLGVAIAPESYAGASDTVGVELDAPNAVRNIGMTWRTDVRLPQPAERLRDMVAEEFALSREQ
ncbi:LysR family transcriptional regulator [Gordonia humi]|uniref:DNA-binding transcriptional LysR family regulator n=1 Tax=Gordonia humi TaxID=686429 RepID=A0A840EW66_9ACTN|nr:LysR family transcriptional regulator [Gordonia humi]MBB4134076.1 DNA-binding transcriptional LysR family regulator [Gordonia humi]